MCFVAVDKNKAEWIYLDIPDRRMNQWDQGYSLSPQVELPKGSIKKLIGRELTWGDEPVELK